MSIGVPGRMVVGCVNAQPAPANQPNAWASRKAPLWCQSSDENQSATGACGDEALSAGWASIMPAAA
jgi:hypothetical protein